jgi:hypothetical protein
VQENIKRYFFITSHTGEPFPYIKKKLLLDMVYALKSIPEALVLVADQSSVDASVQSAADAVVVDHYSPSYGHHWNGELGLIQSSLRLLEQVGAEWACKITYDAVLNPNTTKLIAELATPPASPFEFVGSYWGPNGIQTGLFYGKTSFLRQLFDLPIPVPNVTETALAGKVEALHAWNKMSLAADACLMLHGEWAKFGNLIFNGGGTLSGILKKMLGME